MGFLRLEIGIFPRLGHPFGLRLFTSSSHYRQEAGRQAILTQGNSVSLNKLSGDGGTVWFCLDGIGCGLFFVNGQEPKGVVCIYSRQVMMELLVSGNHRQSEQHLGILFN